MENSNGGGVSANLGRYKELIEFVYNATKDEEYKDGFKGLGDQTLILIVGELVKRGVLTKVRHSKGYRKGIFYAYKWVATSEPTPHFVRSVADAIHKNQRDQAARRYAASPAGLSANTGEPVYVKSDYISKMTVEELWAELKKRGAVIRNNKLMIVTYKEIE